MQNKIAFVDKDGKEFAILDEVDENITLSELRLRASKSLKFFHKDYRYIWKDTQISARQEAVLRVRKCCERTSTGLGEENILKIVILASGPKEKNNKEKESTETLGKDKKCQLKKYQDNEIVDPTISKLEQERRCFWNDLSRKVDCHPVYEDWNVQARNGIMHTEWTLRKTELLKLDAEAIFRDDSSVCEKTSGNHKKIRENLDRMLQAELCRKSSYEKIEDLHNASKNYSTERGKIEENIENEEDALDRVITDLKSSQAALEMAIKHSRLYIRHSKENSSNVMEKVDPELQVPKITELSDDEMNALVASTIDDFSVV